jgi:hypothetical protein
MRVPPIVRKLLASCKQLVVVDHYAANNCDRFFIRVPFAWLASLIFFGRPRARANDIGTRMAAIGTLRGKSLFP